MGRRKGEQWKHPQGRSFLHSVWDKEGLEELNRLWFQSHRMTLGQSVHLSDPEFPHLQNGSS